MSKARAGRMLVADRMKINEAPEGREVNSPPAPPELRLLGYAVRRCEAAANFTTPTVSLALSVGVSSAAACAADHAASALSPCPATTTAAVWTAAAADSAGPLA